MDDEANEKEDDDNINVLSAKFKPLQAIYSKRIIIPYPSAPVLDNIAKASSLLSKSKNLYEKIQLKNLFNVMAEEKGPLAFLRTCLEKRIRIKVWTRGAREIRGHCIGFVAAFDKHWNLALEDVYESWTRKIKRKSVHAGEANPLPIAWKAMGPMVTPPKIKIVKSDKKNETCERHVNQMLIRGEQIAFISVSGT